MTVNADVVVVGGGPAGVSAALRARELGATVTLVERGRLGGTCTNDGCVPTRVLARAARLVRDAAQLEGYGIVGAGTPVVDLPAVLARVRQVVDDIHTRKQLAAHLAETGVHVREGAGAARFVDAHTLALPDGTQLTGAQFVLCAGGHARRLPLPGGDLARTHSDVWSLERLPERLAVVGAAATGVQLASVFAAFGSHVTLLDAADRVLPGEDPDVSAAVAAALRANGVDVITGVAGAERLDRLDEGIRLTWRGRAGQTGARGPLPAGGHTSAGGPGPGPGAGHPTPAGDVPAGVSGLDDLLHTVDVDEAVFAVGWPGNTGGLGLDAAGVATDRGYVTVDDTLRTSAGHIWAAGDLTGRMMLVQSATVQARLAVENALLGTAHHDDLRIVPHGGFTDPEYGSVGLTEPAARDRHGDRVTVATVSYEDLDRGVVDGHAEGFCKLVVDRDDRRLLGVHVVGEQAVEVVQLAATAMAGGLRVEELADVQFAYPTFTAVVGLAARRAARALGAVPVSPQWRALGRLGAADWERHGTPARTSGVR